MKIGNVYCTRGIYELIEERVINIKDIIKALDSFSICDYGSLCENDVKFQNDYFKIWRYRRTNYRRLFF